MLGTIVLVRGHPVTFGMARASPLLVLRGFYEFYVRAFVVHLPRARKLTKLSLALSVTSLPGV